MQMRGEHDMRWTIKIAVLTCMMGLSAGIGAMQDQGKRLEQKICALEKLLEEKNKKIVRKNRTIKRKNKVLRTQKSVIEVHKTNMKNYENALSKIVTLYLNLHESLQTGNGVDENAGVANKNTQENT